MRRLWRRRWLIAVIVIAATGIAALISFSLTPRYTAMTNVMIEPRQSQVVEIQEVLSELPPNKETLNNEIQVIRSRRLAAQVVDKNKLIEDPEFNRALVDPSTLSLAFGWVTGLLGGDETKRLTPGKGSDPQREKLIDAFLNALSVKPVPFSTVMNVSVESEDPEKAARLANSLANLYLADQLKAKFEATTRATRWLGEQLAELREKVAASERAVEAYRQQSGLVRGAHRGEEAVTLVDQQISELSSALISARSNRAEAGARLEQIERALKSRRGVGSSGIVLSSPLIQSLLLKESEIVGKKAELAAEFGPKHPRMMAAEAEIEDVRKKIRAEVQKVVESVRSDVEVARAREVALEKSLKVLESQVGNQNQKDVNLRALEREAAANRSLIEVFLVRFKETSAQADLHTPDARITSLASVPTRPSYPKKGRVIGLAFFASVFFATLLAITLEWLRRGFGSTVQIERVTGLYALGLIPMLEGGRRNRPRPHDYVLENQSSNFAEAIRSLRFSLALTNVDNPPKTIMFTSSLPEEGKSAVALSLARLMARTGYKVLIIDCDNRHPKVHGSLKLAGNPGLVDLLVNNADLRKVIQRDEDSGAHVIAAGKTVPCPAELLGSRLMKALLDKCAEHYDLVILDSPPVLAVSDARTLSAQVDKTVFVVQWQKTRRETAVLALNLLRESRADIAGVVLSRVDAKKHAKHGYEDSDYYHKKAQKYYAT